MQYRDPGEKDQLLPPKVAEPATQPHKCSSITQENKLQLPFSSLEEEFRVSRTREALAYQDSSGTRVASAGIVVRIGRKFEAREGLSWKCKSRRDLQTMASGPSPFSEGAV